MKRVTQLIMTLLIVSLTISQATAQTNNCVADFNILSNSGLTVSFNNESLYNSPLGVLPIVSWDFGDNTTSNDYDITHTFPAAGTYLVCLSAFELNGDLCDTYCESITVGLVNTTCSDYSAAATYTGTEIVLALSTSTPGVPFPDPVTWVLDGVAIGTGASLTYSPGGPGLYDFCANYGINGITCPPSCTSIIIPGPPCDLTIDPFIQDLTGLFTALLPDGQGFPSVSWTITGAGMSFSDMGNPLTFDFPSAGTWDICAVGTITDPVTGITCIEDACITVTVTDPVSATCNDYYPVATTSGNIIAMTLTGNNSSLPLPDQVEWILDGGGGIIGSGQSLTWVAPGPGVYTLCAEFTLNGAPCPATCMDVTIAGAANCEIDFDYDPTPTGSWIFEVLPNSTGTYDGITWTVTAPNGASISGAGSPYNVVFPTSGVYSVCVSADFIDANGSICPVSHCENVTITNNTTCDLNITPDIQGLNGVFTAETPDGDLFTTAAWVISDNSVSYTGSGNPYTFVFPSAGTWQVCVIGTIVDPLTGESCTEDGCITLTITDPNTPDCDIDINYVLNGLTIDLESINTQGSPFTNTDWLITGNGVQVTASGNMYSYTFPSAGTYQVCGFGTIIDPVNNMVLCNADTCITVNVIDNNTPCNFDAVATSSGNIVVMTLTTNDPSLPPPSQVEWILEGGGGVIGSGQTFTWNAPGAGTYTLCAEYDILGISCPAECTTITTFGDPNCEIDFESDLLGSGGLIFTLLPNNAGTYTDIVWTFTDAAGVTLTELGTPAILPFSSPGTYYVCVQANLVDASGNIICQVTHCEDVTLPGGNDDCSLDIVSSITGLLGTFDANNTAGPEFTNVIWTVTGGGATWTDTGLVLDFMFPAPGTYNICAVGELIDAAGQMICASDGCLTVTVSDNSNCPIEFGFDIIDNNLTTIFEVSSNPGTGFIYDNVTWEIVSPNGTTDSGMGSPFTYVFPATGLYIICVEADIIDNNGNVICEASSCESIDVEDPNAPCEAFFEGEEYLNSPLPVQNQAIFYNLSSGNYTDVLWDFGDNTVSDSAADELTHIYANPGVYNVCLTVSNPNDPNCNDTYCELIFITGVNPCNFDVTISVSGQVFAGSIVAPDGTTPTVSEWYIAEANNTVDIGPGPTISYTFPDPGVYQVCVDYAIPGTTCSGTICEEITANNDDCAIVECVFPGDANYDEVADNFDILNIGLGFGTMGPVRPNASNQWYGQAGPDWNEMFDDGTNYKHADCDGDGEIGFDDIEPVILNYNRTHNGVVPTNFGPEPPIWIEFDLDTIYLNPNSANITINADVMVGTASLPANDIYGLAFTVNYPAELVEEGSVEAEYDDSSFLGPSDNTLQLEMVLPADNVIDFGYARTDQQNVSGFGTVATTSYVIIDNLIGFAPQVEYEFTLSITDIRVITNTGEELQFAAQNATAIILVDDQTTSINEPLANAFSIFPNPASSQVNIEYDNASDELVTIFNSLGQQVMISRLTGKITSIDVSDFSTGIYLISIHTEDGIVTKRVMVE